ncbi:YdeI/OmpD-associated family protein [Flavobacterium lindanitolerans]|uniref:YdeI/OmpD-associated family protein n=1 Tax=Flavobacterium lindanitolerans TaxID=428988 RepID=UPI0028098DA8|nr:YdeI/OmpD-associated family protein [Flavobacterium lindanitolerans]MDQ7961036.1 YdeI/OmpD-associated family protein [Flavobacterium lindanitolerans]
MAQFDSKVDAYIAKSEDFAKPILEHWRKLVYATCPGVVEAVKWGNPHFDYKGDFMCVMAAYKKHCSFTFLKAELMNDSRLKDKAKLKPTERYLGKISSLSDLPDDSEFIAFLKETMALNEKGIKISMKKNDTPKAVETPDYFLEKLTTNPKAKEIFESKSAAFRKEYALWITDAKTDATRQKRMDEAIEWIAEGKSRFWKYAK